MAKKLKAQVQEKEITSPAPQQEEESKESKQNPVVDESDLSIAELITKHTGFVCANADKLERVVFGMTGREGEIDGGIGEAAARANPMLALAHYDKIAGFILKDGIKIKTGSFWNFKRGVNAPHKEPQVKYLFNFGGNIVEVDDPSELASAVQTMQKAESNKAAEQTAKRRKARASSLVVGM